MYFITLVNPASRWCVGYYPTLSEAVDVLENQSCTLYEEDEYPYAVIEKINKGVFQYDLNPVWYKYNTYEKHYEIYHKPYFIHNKLVGFAFG
jgi:hypothetical protein